VSLNSSGEAAIESSSERAYTVIAILEGTLFVFAEHHVEELGTRAP
jgi:hypothetical protein